MGIKPGNLCWLNEKNRLALDKRGGGGTSLVEGALVCGHERQEPSLWFLYPQANRKGFDQSGGRRGGVGLEGSG